VKLGQASLPKESQLEILLAVERYGELPDRMMEVPDFGKSLRTCELFYDCNSTSDGDIVVTADGTSGIFSPG